ncbi:MAG TPA: SRPBCC family protein [Chitinophagales bacterium]|nr:SRPBCC family protein [Chitinophagales bacterium]
MIFEYSNHVQCTKEEAWKFIIDLERRPDWIHFQEKCYWTEKKPGMIGSRYQEKEVFLGIPLNINYEVTHWVEYERMSSKCMMPPFYPVVDVIVVEEEDGCFCSLIINAKLGPFFLVPEKFLRKQVDALVQPLVDKFIDILESESVLKRPN